MEDVVEEGDVEAAETGKAAADAAEVVDGGAEFGCYGCVGEEEVGFLGLFDGERSLLVDGVGVLGRRGRGVGGCGGGFDHG